MAIKISANWLDRVIGFFAPQMAAKRLAYRQAMGLFTRSNYDGAAQGRRTKGWKTTNADAASAISADLSTLRSRSRDLVRNNAYATKAVNTIVSNAVGTGIIAKFGADYEAYQKNWKRWSDSTDCDYYGKMNFYQLQSLVLRAIVESGEILIRKRRGTKDGQRIQLELLEPDFLDTSISKKDGSVMDGIEFDLATGRPVQYHIFRQHPGSRVPLSGRFIDSVPVPASEIIHVFRTDRPGQIRGVPWASPVMLRMRDYDDYEDAQLVRQKIASCFVGFITNTEDPLTQTSTTQEQKPISEKFSPGAWEVLGPGKDIKFGMPPSVGADYEPYVRRMLLALAAGFGISYEALTGDLSQVNFSSGRMGWIEFHRNIEAWRWNMFIPGFCEPAMQWWLEGESVGQKKTPELYEMQTTWTPPRREMIDPVKEVSAMRDSIRAGLSTFSDSVRQLGFDPKDHFTEYANDLKMLDSFKLTLDSDPRKDLQSSNGNAQSSGQKNSSGAN